MSEQEHCHTKMGTWCHKHQTVHGQEAHLIKEALDGLCRTYHKLRIPNMYLTILFEDQPPTDSSLVIPTPPGRADPQCLWGHFCHKHEVIHGTEATVIRQHITALMNKSVNTGGVYSPDVIRMYRDLIAPYDSLCWLEENWGK